MMTTQLIVTELCNRGYKVEHKNVIKNGLELEGIIILSDSNIAPVIYTEPIIKKAERENKSLDDVVTTIIDIYEEHKGFEFDVDMFLDKEFILNNIYIGLQKSSTEDVEKKSCELDGIESYLYVRKDKNQEESYSIKINKSLLDKANISEVDAWEYAQNNTFAETYLISMEQLMCGMMQMEHLPDEMENNMPLYIITNKSKTKGASAILNKKVLSDFGKRFDTDKVVVLPSSVHEMLIMPYTEETDMDFYSSMVKEVNQTEVEPTERLTDRAYIINV